MPALDATIVEDRASRLRRALRSAAHRRIVRSFLRRELAPCARCTLTDREPPPAPA